MTSCAYVTGGRSEPSSNTATDMDARVVEERSARLPSDPTDFDAGQRMGSVMAWRTSLGRQTLLASMLLEAASQSQQQSLLPDFQCSVSLDKVLLAGAVFHIGS